MLQQSTIDALHTAIVTARLDRAALLSGVAPAFATNIPIGTSQSSQTVIDIRYLAEAVGDPHPLETYLRTAIALTPLRAEQPVFEHALGELRRALRARSATTGAPEDPPPVVNRSPDREALWASDKVRCYISSHVSDSAALGKIETHLAPLVTSGAMDVWHRGLTPAGVDFEALAALRLAQADIVIFLVSAEFLASKPLMEEARLAFERQGEGQGKARIIPIFARACDISYTPFAKLRALPRNGRPLSSQSNADEAYSEIAVAIRAIVDDTRAFHDDSQNRGAATLGLEPTSRGSKAGIPIGDIFSPGQTVSATYVEPVEDSLIRASLLSMGRGLVVEGPSQIGKTTAVQRALGASKAKWVDAKSSSHVDELVKIIDAGRLTGHLVIDDVHWLDADLFKRLALFIRQVAEASPATGKVTVIGLSHAGQSLFAAHSHLGARVKIIRMGRQPDERIRDLISLGERAANLRFVHKSELVAAAQGSFSVAQQLCYEAAIREVSVSPAKRRDVKAPPSDVEGVVAEELKDRFETNLVRLIESDAGTPTPGGVLALLYLAASARDEGVPIGDAEEKYPHLAPSFAWFKAGGLASLLEKQHALGELVHATATKLAVGDPLVRFYLRFANWVNLASQARIRASLTIEGELSIHLSNAAPAHASSQSTRSAREQSILSIVPFPWSDPRADRLLEILLAAYPDVSWMRVIALKAGIPLGRWNPNVSPEAAMRQLIDLAVGAEMLHTFIDTVLQDPNAKRFHRYIQEAIADGGTSVAAT